MLIYTQARYDFCISLLRRVPLCVCVYVSNLFIAFWPLVGADLLVLVAAFFFLSVSPVCFVSIP